MADLIYYKHKAPKRGAGARAANAQPVVFEGRELAPWTLKAARNGNPILPDEVYAVLREECAKFPGRVTSDEVFAIVLERTACRTQHLGMGLSRKSGGRHVTHPDPRVGDVAEDILQHRDTGHHWDVFGSAAVGNPLNPGQGPSIGVIDTRTRPWVGPVCSDAGHGGGGGNGGDNPPPPPPPPPPPATDLSGVLAALARIESTVGDIRGRVGALEARPEVGAELRADDVMGHIRRELNYLREAADKAPAGGGERCKFPSRIFGAGEAQAVADALRKFAVEGDPERPQGDT